MVYYEIAKLREITLGSSSDTSQDAILNNFGTQADAKIDRMLKISLTQNKASALPVVPLSSPSQDIKDAATNIAASLYFAFIRNIELSKFYMDLAKETITAYTSEQGLNEGTFVLRSF